MSIIDHEIKTLFETNCQDLVFDEKLAKKVSGYQIGFVNKNEEHMVFFGGNLTGVQVVRFTTADKDKWFSEILEADDIVMEEALLEVNAIDKNWHVATNIFNMSCLWVIHKFLTSDLDEKIKARAALDAALALQYKFLSSLLYQFFRFPCDSRTAQAAYAQLSYKFSLKKFGSWYATLENRCKDLVDKDGLHYQTLLRFDNDVDIIKALNDSQGRLRDMMKNIYSVLMDVHRSGVKIKTTNSLLDNDGEVSLKDKTHNLNNYTKYLQSVLGDKDSFIKLELTELIEKIMFTMSPKMFLTSLEWCSDNYIGHYNKEIDELVTETMIHSFGYMSDNRTVIKNNHDLATLLTRLRGVYMSSRSTDPDLMKLRKLSTDVIKKATKSKNENMIAAIRTGLLLYIVLRAMTYSHYSK